MPVSRRWRSGGLRQISSQKARTQELRQASLSSELAASREHFPMSMGIICISYFRFLGTIVHYLLFKATWGGVGDAAIVTSGLQYFPFCLQSSHSHFAHIRAGRRSPLPSFTRRASVSSGIQVLRGSQQPPDPASPQKLLSPPTVSQPISQSRI